MLFPLDNTKKINQIINSLNAGEPISIVMIDVDSMGAHLRILGQIFVQQIIEKVFSIISEELTSHGFSTERDTTFLLLGASYDEFYIIFSGTAKPPQIITSLKVISKRIRAEISHDFVFGWMGSEQISLIEDKFGVTNLFCGTHPFPDGRIMFLVKGKENIDTLRELTNSGFSIAIGPEIVFTITAATVSSREFNAEDRPPESLLRQMFISLSEIIETSKKKGKNTLIFGRGTDELERQPIFHSETNIWNEILPECLKNKSLCSQIPKTFMNFRAFSEVLPSLASKKDFYLIGFYPLYGGDIFNRIHSKLDGGIRTLQGFGKVGSLGFLNRIFREHISSNLVIDLISQKVLEEFPTEKWHPIIGYKDALPFTRLSSFFFILVSPIHSSGQREVTKQLANYLKRVIVQVNCLLKGISIAVIKARLFPLDNSYGEFNPLVLGHYFILTAFNNPTVRTDSIIVDDLSGLTSQDFQQIIYQNYLKGKTKLEETLMSLNPNTRVEIQSNYWRCSK